jgi:hypothetical protein
MSSKTLALTLSDNTRNRDNSAFIYHFQNCTALTTQCSATFSVSKYITESLAKTEMYELGVMGTKHVPEALLIQDPSLMFEMGTGRLLVHDGVGGTNFY